MRRLGTVARTLLRALPSRHGSVDNPPLERTAAAVYFVCGRALRVRRRGRSTALRYPAVKRYRGIIVLVLLVATWLTAEWLLQRRTVPPASVTDFASFVHWRQSPRRIEVVQQGGAEYLITTGPAGGVVPSGPSAYVFDRSGRLVDWSSDMGDDPRFRDKWPPTWFGKGRELDRDGALKWIAEGRAAAG